MRKMLLKREKNKKHENEMGQANYKFFFDIRRVSMIAIVPNRKLSIRFDADRSKVIQYVEGSRMDFTRLSHL